MKYGRKILLLFIALSTLLFAACDRQFEATINFYVDDTLYHTIETAGNDSIAMPPDPVKEGYVFKGWYWDKDTWDRALTVNSFLNEPITESFSVYAYFTLAQSATYPLAQFFVVTFVADGATVGTVVTDGKSAVTLPADPNKDNCSFEGWFTDNGVWSNPFTSNTPVSENVTVYARFKALPVLTFVADGATVGTVVTDGKSAVSLPADPYKDNCSFEGWFTDNGVWSKPFTSNTPVSENVTVYARFKALPVLTFVADGATVGTVVTDGKSAVTLPADPYKGGYSFEGWFTDNGVWGKPFTSNTPVSENVTVYARFSPIADLFVIPDATANGNVFNTISDAINAAESGATIFISAGLYQETLVINKPVTLLGNNYDIKAGEQRRAETIITIGENLGDDVFMYNSTNEFSQSGKINSIITVNCSNVALKGLTLDGNNPFFENIWSEARQQILYSSPSYAETSSSYYASKYLAAFYGKDIGIDAAAGISMSTTTELVNGKKTAVYKTVIIENNVIKNFWQFGIRVNNTTADSLFSGNEISNVLPLTTQVTYGTTYGAYGVAISFSGGANGTITQNIVKDSQAGVQVQTTGELTANILSNQFLNCNTGIWLNSIYTGPMRITIKDNKIVFESDLGIFNPFNNFGIVASTITNIKTERYITIDGNHIANYNYGIGLAKVKDTNLTLNNNEFMAIDTACIGFLDVLMGYSFAANSDVDLTLENNNYNDNLWLLCTNSGTILITENDTTTPHTKIS